MNTFIWFTCRKNENFLIQSIKSVLENFTSPKRLCIAFDRKNNESMSIETINKILHFKKIYNIEILLTGTDFNRKGNLNGIPCIEGMLNFFTKFINNSDVIFKMDDDIVLFKENYVNHFLSNPKYLSFGGKRYISSPGQYDEGLCYGAFYGMRRELIFNLNKEVNHALNFEEYIRSVTSSNQKISSFFPEDLTFSMMIKSILSEEQRNWIDFTLNKGFMGGWQYKHKNYSKGYDFFDMINFGNKYLIKENIQETVENAMRKSLDEFLNKKP